MLYFLHYFVFININYAIQPKCGFNCHPIRLPGAFLLMVLDIFYQKDQEILAPHAAGGAGGADGEEKDEDLGLTIE